MAEVVLDVKVNTGASTNALKEARQEIKNLTAAALEAEKAGNSALADTYAKKAAEARDQVKDLQEKINALDPGAKAQAFAAFGQTVAGGLTAAISATALFGDKNKDLESTLVKVQSATALLQATQSIADGLKQASVIKTVALTTAQNLYTIAVGASTGAMKAFKVALLATGIGAIVALLAQAVVMYQKLTDETEQATRATDAYNKALQRNSEELNDNLTSLSNRERLLLAQAKAEGKSQDEILNIQKQFINKRIDAQTIFANKLREKQRDLTADEIKSLIDAEKEIENLKIEYQVLELQRIENFNNQRLQKEKDYLDKKKEDDAKKKADEEKKKQDEAKKLADDEKKRQDAIELAKQQDASFKSQTQQEYQDSIKLTTDYYDNLIKQKQLNNEDTTALEIEKAQTLINVGKDYGQNVIQQELDLALKQKEIADKKREQEIADAEKLRQAKISIAQSGINALASLGNIAIKNEAQREKFQKKIAATQILLDTAIAISQMIRDGSKVGITPIEKAVAITTGIALVLGNMAKATALLSKAGTSTPPTLQGGGGGGSISVPTAPTPTVPVFNPQGTIIPQGQEQGQQAIKAYVLEDDISTSQNRITDIKTKALYG